MLWKSRHTNEMNDAPKERNVRRSNQKSMQYIESFKDMTDEWLIYQDLDRDHFKLGQNKTNLPRKQAMRLKTSLLKDQTSNLN